MLLTTFALSIAALAPLQDSARVNVGAEYRRLAEEQDAAGLAKLWGAHPSRILGTIDSDLEGSLSTWEASPDRPDMEKIKMLHTRALWGAKIASEVTGRPIFNDYASSFVGWTRVQKESFRSGQAAYGRAGKALKEGKAEDALRAARECRTRALPLGDWWGTAMGMSAEARALTMLDKHEEALAQASQARLIYGQLGLTGNEYGNVKSMVAALLKLERWPRALVAVDDALALAKRLGDREGEKSLSADREKITKALAG